MDKSRQAKGKADELLKGIKSYGYSVEKLYEHKDQDGETLLWVLLMQNPLDERYDTTDDSDAIQSESGDRPKHEQLSLFDNTNH